MVGTARRFQRSASAHERSSSLSGLASPPAALRLYLATTDDLTAFDTLVDLTSLDPVFAAEVLRVANTATYARTGPVSSLRAALVVIGMRVLRRLALSFGARAATTALRLPPGVLDIFWWQSTVRASTCATLAGAVGVDEDDAFTVGLLQDLGLLVMLHEKPDRAAAWSWLFHVGVDERRALEHEFFDDDHAECFLELGSAWGLPRSIVDAIGAHHDTARGPALPTTTSKLARLAAAADIVAQHTGPTSLTTDAGVRDAVGGLGVADVDGVLEQLPRCADATALALGVMRPRDVPAELARAALRELVERGNREAERLRALEQQLEERERADASLRRSQAELQQKAYTDPLTGLGNRRAFDEAFERAIDEARRARTAVSLVLFDIDHFKSVNDRWGHDAGDLVLRAVAQVVVGHTRASDVRARIGGEELAVLLPGAPAAVGERIAEKIRDAVSALRIDHDGQILSVTVSAGGRTVVGPAGDTRVIARQTFRETDAALYVSKRRGRNRVTWAIDDVLVEPCAAESRTLSTTT